MSEESCYSCKFMDRENIRCGLGFVRITKVATICGRYKPRPDGEKR